MEILYENENIFFPLILAYERQVAFPPSQPAFLTWSIFLLLFLQVDRVRELAGNALANPLAEEKAGKRQRSGE